MMINKTGTLNPHSYQALFFPRKWLWLSLSMCVLILAAPILVNVLADAAESTVQDSDMELGMRHFEQGHFSQAAQAWEQAARRFEQEKRLDEQAQALLYFSEALYHLGQYRRAAVSLQLAHQIASEVPNPLLVSQILGRLGNVAFALGLETDAEEYLTMALSGARALENLALVATILNDRGNVLAS